MCAVPSLNLRTIDARLLFVVIDNRDGPDDGGRDEHGERKPQQAAPPHNGKVKETQPSAAAVEDVREERRARRNPPLQL